MNTYKGKRVSVREQNFRPIIDESTSGTTYFGFALPGTATSSARWRILRAVEASGITTFTYADGDDKFDNIWDDHASLPYS